MKNEFIIKDNILTSYKGTDSVVYIPNTVNVIASYAFSLNVYATKVVIPDSVTIIEENAFRNSPRINEIILGNCVNKIGDYAFKSTSIKTITIPQSVKHIGENIFEECHHLLEITNNSSINDNDLLLSIGEKIPSKLKIIHEGESKLKKEGNFLLLNDDILIDCYNIKKSLNIPLGIKEIYHYAINSNSLKEIIFPSSLRHLYPHSVHHANEVKELIFNKGLLDIDNYAVDTLYKVEKIYIPASVRKIGFRAFSFCPNLQSIEVDKDNKYYSSKDGILYSKDFKELIYYPPKNKLSSFTIDESITTIDYFALEHCPLKEISYIDNQHNLRKLINYHLESNMHGKIKKIKCTDGDLLFIKRED